MTPPIFVNPMPSVPVADDAKSAGTAFPISGKKGILSRILEILNHLRLSWDKPWHADEPHARLTAILLMLLASPATIYAQATGKLNDTGITTCANATSNSVPCGFADGDTYGHPRQEAEYGRAAKDAAPGNLLTKTGASDANSKGYDYKKLAYVGGAELAAGTAQGTTNATWGCTKDIVTGLIWDMKVTTATNARLNTNTYNWKITDAGSNGGAANEGATGVAAATSGTDQQCYVASGTYYCDTTSYVAYINTLNICGANGWRLPTRLELLSIVDASKQGTGAATVDASYFPSIMPARYWTADNLAGNPNEARTVNMASGSDGTAPKSSVLHVILVRP